MNTVTKLTQIFTVTLILGSTLNSCTSGETRQEKVLMREPRTVHKPMLTMRETVPR